MTLSREDDEMDMSAAKVHEPKRPYEKPEMRYERIFETMALSCGKTGPTNFACRTNRNAS